MTSKHTKHIKDRSIIEYSVFEPRFAHKYPKIFLSHTLKDGQLIDTLRKMRVENMRGFGEGCVEGSDIWNKKQQRDELKHYLNTDYLDWSHRRSVWRREYANGLLSSSWSRSETLGHYKKFLIAKFRTGFNNFTNDRK